MKMGKIFDGVVVRAASHRFELAELGRRDLARSDVLVAVDAEVVTRVGVVVEP